MCVYITLSKQAFPDVPWAFVYRQPVQTMMSHMDPDKNNQGNAPCMRSKRNPPQDVSENPAVFFVFYQCECNFCLLVLHNDSFAQATKRFLWAASFEFLLFPFVYYYNVYFICLQVRDAISKHAPAWAVPNEAW